MNFHPTNRYLLIQTAAKEQVEKTGVLLPEGYNSPKDKFVVATVVESAPDCKTTEGKIRYPNGNKIVVDNAMIETVSVEGKEFEIVLENYIVGLVGEG
tara:strand:- start:1302 stop:1595 length:294 start_codon:yes stop_codon:yes gene_type:complete